MTLDKAAVGPDWDSLYATRMKRVAPSEIRERMRLINQHSLIHLGGGLPDPAIFAYDLLAEASAAILGDPARARVALQYAPSEGHLPLREWLTGYMASLGVPCGLENIVITNGSQQALDLIGKMLLDPGDVAAVEMPSFIGALRAFDAYQPQYIAIPEDPTATGATLAGAKLAYAGPDFRNPTGTTLTRAEREALLTLAAAAGTPIIEDSCYEKLRFVGETIPSLLALGVARTGSIENAGVLYTGTFSKTIAPSLRVGWVAGPAAAVRKLTLLKQASDLATSALNQMVLLDVVRDHLDSEAVRMSAVYAERCGSMLDALARHMPADVSWTRPEGGLYVWGLLPEGMDGSRFAERALVERGVSTISGAAFYPSDPRKNTIRLSFSLASVQDAAEGIRRIAELVEEMRG